MTEQNLKQKKKNCKKLELGNFISKILNDASKLFQANFKDTFGEKSKFSENFSFKTMSMIKFYRAVKVFSIKTHFKNFSKIMNTNNRSNFKANLNYVGNLTLNNTFFPFQIRSRN